MIVAAVVVLVLVVVLAIVSVSSVTISLTVPRKHCAFSAACLDWIRGEVRPGAAPSNLAADPARWHKLVRTVSAYNSHIPHSVLKER